jgi:hypothetical protein
VSDDQIAVDESAHVREYLVNGRSARDIGVADAGEVRYEAGDMPARVDEGGVGINLLRALKSYGSDFDDVITVNVQSSCFQI